MGLLAALWLGLHGGIGAVAAPSVEAQLERSTVAVGETVTLSLIVREGQPEEVPDLKLPPEIGLIGQQRSQSTQIDVTRGRTVSTVTLGYVLQPSRVGEFTIPRIAVRLADRVLTTAPVKLTVVAAQATPTADASGLAVLRLHVAKTNVVLGQQVPVQIQLFFQQADINQMPQLPAEGFTAGPMPQPRRGRSRSGEREYSVLVFDTILVPAKTGALTVGPAEMNVVLRVPTNDRRARDIFDEFFDSGPRARRQPMKLQSDPVVVDVSPPPEQGKPASFLGAVGQFTWTVSAGPTELAVGDPVTLKIQVTGEGHLDAITLPSLAGDDFKAYPPNARVETTDPLGAKGSKTFEQILVPRHERVDRVPELLLSYFDPEKRTYQTLRHPAIPLRVTPSAASASTATPAEVNRSGGNASAGAEAPVPAVRPLGVIRPEMGVLLATHPPVGRGGLFWGIQGVPVLLWLATWLWRIRQERWDRNPRARRRQAVELGLQTGLRQLRELADRNDRAGFFATTFRLLQDGLGERLDMPSGGITEAVLDSRLPELGADAALIRQLHDVFALCNQARYAGQGTGSGLHDERARIEDALRQLAALSPVPAGAAKKGGAS